MPQKCNEFEVFNKTGARWAKKLKELEELDKVEKAKERSPPPWAIVPELVDASVRGKPSALRIT